MSDLPSFESIRSHCRDQLAALPARLLALDAKPDYPITYSDALRGRCSAAVPIVNRRED